MAKKILIVGESKDGALRKTTLEVLAAGRALAAKSGGAPEGALVGSGLDKAAAEFAAQGVTVHSVDHAAYARYAVDTWAEALVRLVRERGYEIVLFADTTLAKDLAPVLAASLDAALVTDVVHLDVGPDGLLRAVHPIFTGKVNAEFVLQARPVQVLTVRPHTYPAATADGAPGTVEKLDWSPERAPRTEVVERVAAAADRVELAEAEVVVSGGRSLKSEENFKIIEALASVLGGAVGASRAAVDAGYQPHSRQVGQTGKVVNPSLYVACGISGAIQHLVGMRTSKVIVAVNKDPNAPIFQNADYGVVGDLFEIVPLLTQEFKKLLGKE